MPSLLVRAPDVTSVGLQARVVLIFFFTSTTTASIKQNVLTV
jgi:hypothetical protein